MNTLKTALLLLIGTSLFSCRNENSEDIDQSEIYTDYRIIYKEDVDRTFVRATFKHESNTGENLKLGEEAKISADGTDMVWHSTFFRYEYDFPGLEDVSIGFTDNEGNNFNNALSFNKVAEYNTLTSNNDSLYKDSIQFIAWDNAGPLASSEYVNLIMIQNNSVIVLSNDTVGATGVYVEATTFNAFQLGDIEVHFEKWIDVSLNTPTAGGNGKAQTISVTQTVKLLN
tara:strand:+ start:2430 stop:3113 length:684 start_codon:yes stop_codon:yes gene_type:complete